MEMDMGGYYAAFASKDSRFDGRFFVGIASTGIYCRPVCRARLPKKENCHFYQTAAEAEAEGYRPCLLCRPELAPGRPFVGAAATLAERAAYRIEERCAMGEGLEQIARSLGCTGRHLRRVFAQEYRVSPVRYLQTCRLLLAKSILTQTDLPVVQVAMAAGFGSLRRLNDLFARQYGLSPTALRKGAPAKAAGGEGATLALGYRPPYRWEELLDFLGKRAIPGVEAVEGGAYFRTCRLRGGRGEARGWIRVGRREGKDELSVTLSASLLPVVPQVLAGVRRLFDLDCDPGAVSSVLARMDAIRPNAFAPGTRLPGCFDTFEMAVRAVLGQQITVKAARTLAARLVAEHGHTIRTGIEGLTHIFPSPEEILSLQGPIAERLGPLGITSARARTIEGLAAALTRGEIALDATARPEEEMEKLLAIPGIGPWTAHYVAMRAMGWPDAFLPTDAGVKKALAPRTQREMEELAQGWRPWRSYAVVSLWNGLS